MKKINTLLLLLFIGTFGLAQTELSGTVSNYKPGDKVYLYEYFGADLIIKDTADINNGKFTFSYKETLGYGMYQIGKAIKETTTFVLHKEPKVGFELDYSNVRGNSRILPSKENQLFYQYSGFMARFFPYYNKVQRDYQSNSYLQSRNPAMYQQNAANLERTLDSLHKLIDNYNKMFAEKHKGTFAAKIALTLKADANTNSANYLKPVEFQDEALIRSDVLSNKVRFYTQRFYGGLTYNNFKFLSNNILKFCPAKSGGRNLTYMTLIFDAYGMRRQQDKDATFELQKAYEKEFGDTPYGKSIIPKLPIPPPLIGEEAPEIKLTNVKGDTLKLSSLRGKYVLIDFWAAWCGPCRGESPHLRNAYKTYNAQGFEIYSITLDGKDGRHYKTVEAAQNNWQNAIQKDALNWPNHVWDPERKSNYSMIYGAYSIPTNYLIDPSGKIIAKNLRGHALPKKLSEVFKSSSNGTHNK